MTEIYLRFAIPIPILMTRSRYSFSRLLGESEETIEVRTRAIESLGLLKQALATMDEVKRDVA
eukprot:COSAG01_NODE_1208_length_11239_cov_36.000987_5_plen_63_part_00